MNLLFYLSVIIYGKCGETNPTATAENRNYQFALIPKSNSPFFQEAKEGCIDQSVALTNAYDNSYQVTCEYKIPKKEDAHSQNVIMREIIALNKLTHDWNERIRGIAISVIDSEINSMAINEAMAAGIPVITFDSDSPNSDRISYIGTDNEAFGEQLAKNLELVDPEGGKIGKYALISGIGPNLEKRVNGFRGRFESINSFKSHHWKEINDGTSPADCREQTGIAIAQMYQFAQNPNIKAIISVGGWPMWNTSAFKDFVNIYSNDEKRNLTIIVGDALESQIELLNYGYSQGLVGQVPYEMGQMSLDTLFRLSFVGNKELSIPKESLVTNLIQVVSVPLNLPPLQMQENHLTLSVAVGGVFFVIVTVTSTACALFTFRYRQEHVFRAVPVSVFYMSCFGTFLCSLSIITLSFDDNKHSIEACAIACNLTPWLICTGFIFFFSPLLAIAFRVYLTIKCKISTPLVQIKNRHILHPFMAMLGLYSFILFLWTAILSPFKYVRTPDRGTDAWNRVFESHARCTSQYSHIFGPMLYFISLFLVSLSSYISLYNSYGIETQFHELQWNLVTNAAILQALAIGCPLLLLTYQSDTIAYYFTITSLIFVTCMAVLIFHFIPKAVVLYRLGCCSKLKHKKEEDPPSTSLQPRLETMRE